jgi:hypothetical protein
MNCDGRKKVRRLILTTLAVFVFSVLFDLGSTYLFFMEDYDYTLENENNPVIVQHVIKYGLVGVFMSPFMLWGNYLVISVIGSLVVGIFFFNDFKKTYSYVDRFFITTCLSFLLIATQHFACGIVNLFNLFRMV